MMMFMSVSHGHHTHSYPSHEHHNSQSFCLAHHHTERTLETVPAASSHSQPMRHFSMEWWHSTRQSWEAVGPAAL